MRVHDDPGAARRGARHPLTHLVERPLADFEADRLELPDVENACVQPGVDTPDRSESTSEDALGRDARIPVRVREGAEPHVADAVADKCHVVAERALELGAPHAQTADVREGMASELVSFFVDRPKVVGLERRLTVPHGSAQASADVERRSNPVLAQDAPPLGPRGPREIVEADAERADVALLLDDARTVPPGYRAANLVARDARLHSAQLNGFIGPWVIRGRL